VPFSDPWVQDLGWVKNQDPDPGSGSGMNNPDNISVSLETICRVKILKFSYADLGSGMEKIRIRDPKWKNCGSGMEELRIQDKHLGSVSLGTVVLYEKIMYLCGHDDARQTAFRLHIGAVVEAVLGRGGRTAVAAGVRAAGSAPTAAPRSTGTALTPAPHLHQLIGY